MFARSTLVSVVSLLAVALPAVDAYATTGCYPAGALTAITTGLLTITTTGITTPQACAVSVSSRQPPFVFSSPDRTEVQRSTEHTLTSTATPIDATAPTCSLCSALLPTLSPPSSVVSVPLSAPLVIFR
jgi:hypothetical protein